MREYAACGMGSQSVGMCLDLWERGIPIEVLFVDHGTDWPETYKYAEMFAEKYPVTILKPSVEGESNLYMYCWIKKIFPSFQFAWCSQKFKIKVQQNYMESPANVYVGYTTEEPHRAKPYTTNGITNQYPLIEQGMTRQDCEKIIKRHGLPIPPKSACYICPNQKPEQWKRLRTEHPELFSKADQLEKRVNAKRKHDGKPPIYINGKCSVRATVDEYQSRIWQEDEYPKLEAI